MRASAGTIGGVAYDAGANTIYFTDTTTSRLYRVTVVDPVDVDTWTIIARGAGSPGFVDGTLASARFRAPTGLFFDDASRTLYVADTGNHVIRAVDVDAGTVTTVAGTGETLGLFGDGLAATDALLFQPHAVTRCAASGDLFIADTGNQRVRRVAAGTGVITTVLGDGTAASSGQGSPSATFPVDNPRGLACDAVGNLFVSSSQTVRMLPAAIALGDTTGIVDGTGPVQSIYGAPPRASFPVA